MQEISSCGQKLLRGPVHFKKWSLFKYYLCSCIHWWSRVFQWCSFRGVSSCWCQRTELEIECGWHVVPSWFCLFSLPCPPVTKAMFFCTFCWMSLSWGCSVCLSDSQCIHCFSVTQTFRGIENTELQRNGLNLRLKMMKPNMPLCTSSESNWFQAPSFLLPNLHGDLIYL